MDAVDVRGRWIGSMLHNHFRTVNADKLKRFIQSKEFSVAVSEFLDSGDVKVLWISEQGGKLSAMTKLSSEKKQGAKLIYFAKIGVSKVSEKSYLNEILVGDCSVDPLFQIERVTKDVLVPLLSNPENQSEWPLLIKKDVVENLHTFLADVQITAGLVNGTTRLPLPALNEAKESTKTDKEKVHAYEGCLITWTKQIKLVLKMDSERQLEAAEARGEHPGALLELDFWKKKANNLNAIFEQLQGTDVRKVLLFLDASKSTYNQPFAKLCKDVFIARAEANDNVHLLAPLRPWLESLERESSFSKITNNFRPIMHSLLLVWTSSTYYNTPARIVVFIREVCNEVMRKAHQYLDGERVFALIDDNDLEGAIKALERVIRVCGSLKSVYFDYKAKSQSDCPDNPWRIQNAALFKRFDGFLERAIDVKDFITTIQQFSKLGTVEIGGTKGTTLTTSVQQVHADFANAINTFKAVPYDIMNVDESSFDDDFYEFRVKVKELDRRLASVLSQGFDDCPTIDGRFKLLDCLGLLLTRTIIADELEKKQLGLIVAYSKDLAAVAHIFTEAKDNPPIAKNFPPMSGAVAWSRGLRARVSLPMEKMRDLKGRVLKTDEAKDVVKRFTSFIAMLDEYEKSKLDAWSEQIQSSSIAKLKLPLLTQNSGTHADGSIIRILKVNFDPALVRLLREVKYFSLLRIEVPSQASKIYKRSEQLRRETGNLDLIVSIYNRIQKSLLPVERPLLKSHVAKLDKALMAGLRTLTWKSHGIEPFITEVSSCAKDADVILSTMKENVGQIETIMEAWSKKVMLSKRSKPASVSDFMLLFDDKKKVTYALITKGGKDIHSLMKATVRALKVSNGHPDWKAYVDFVSCVVIEGLARACNVSLKALQDQIDLEKIEHDDIGPIMETSLVLSGKKVIFEPSLQRTPSGKGVKDAFDTMTNAYVDVASLFKRLDSPEGSYVREMTNDPDVQESLDYVYESVEETISRCNEFREKYMVYEYLWTSDMGQIFEDFLEGAFLPIADSGSFDDENGGANDNDGSSSPNPSSMDSPGAWSNTSGEGSKEEPDCPFSTTRIVNLLMFEERISHFQAVRAELAELQSSTQIGFLKLDSQPIKQALSTWVTKWVYMFTQYLHDYTLAELRGLSEFIRNANKGLDSDIDEDGDGSVSREELMSMMRHINSVNRKIDVVQRLFNPFNDTVHMLRGHGITFEGELVDGIAVGDYLSALPNLWNETVDHAFKVKAEIQPIQNQIADKVRGEVQHFQSQLSAHRRDFKLRAPYAGKASVDDANALIDTLEREVAELCKEAKKMADLENLFSLSRSKFRELASMQRDLTLLGQAWDTLSLITRTFTSWEDLMWDELDTDDLEFKARKMLASVRSDLSSAMKSWGVYKLAESKASNMCAVIPLVNELHSPSMRDRHWKRLMQVTHKHFTFTKGVDFSLKQVLQLQLHKYAQEVSEIVDISRKELKIDERLTAIEETWVRYTIPFEAHNRGDVGILAPEPALIEMLEDHQLQLQNMAGMGKYVAYFADRVSCWQKTLGNVEYVLGVWMSVQSQWDSLETIFLGSQDIKAQLPEETRSFRDLDATFVRVMNAAAETPNLVKLCANEELVDQITKMQSTLEICQKSLDEYLEQKKKIFPRFYFCPTRHFSTFSPTEKIRQK